MTSSCEEVSCEQGPDPVVKDAECVDNADCEAVEDTFACQCVEGFVGEGTDFCRDEDDCPFTFDHEEGETFMKVSIHIRQFS